MALICEPKHLRPYAMRTAEWVRVQCNTFVRQRPGVFKRSATIAKHRLSAVLGKLAVCDSTVRFHRIESKYGKGLIMCPFGIDPKGVRELALDVATYLYSVNYSHFLKPGWADTNFGRMLRQSGEDLETALVQFCADAFTAASPGIEVALLVPPQLGTKRKPRAAQKSPVERRAAKAAESLRRWERRLKLAKGKVAKYQKQVAYYAKGGVTAALMILWAASASPEEVFVPGVGYRWVGPVYASPAPPAPPPQSYPGRWKRSAQWGASHSLLRPDNGLPQYGAGDSLLVPNSELHRFDLVPNRIQAVVPISPYNVNPYSNRGFQDALYPKQAR